MPNITLEHANSIEEAAFVEQFGDIFEHAQWVAEAVAGRRPFASLAALYEAMVAAVREAGPDRQRALMDGHPDLAGKAARAGKMAPESVAEQTSAGLDRLSEAEFATFHRLNDAYRAKFGMPFIVCVRRHTKDSVLRQFERRLTHDAATERETTLAEIFRIVALRLDQRVSAPNRLKVHGRLSTHVLDTRIGRPAAGVAVVLVELSDDGVSRTVATAITNVDGRTDAPLIGGRPIPIGTYELHFDVGNYFAQLHSAYAEPLPEPPFLSIVPLRFSIAEPEGHYHVPLLATPWSYATYRGS